MMAAASEQAIGGAPANVKAAYARMTPKQRALAVELPKHDTIEAACVAAGYSKSNARNNCGALAAHADVALVSEYLTSTAVRKSQAAQAKLAPEEVDEQLADGVLQIGRLLEEIKAIATSDARDLFSEDGKLIPFHQLPAHTARAISGVDISPTGGIKIKFWNKLDALEKGLKLLVAYPEPKEKDEKDKPMLVGVVVVPAKAPHAGIAHQVIEGSATRVPRAAEPLNTQAKTFKVLAPQE